MVSSLSVSQYKQHVYSLGALELKSYTRTMNKCMFMLLMLLLHTFF